MIAVWSGLEISPCSVDHMTPRYPFHTGARPLVQTAILGRNIESGVRGTLRTYSVLVFLLLVALFANAQDPQLSQFYAAPLYLNPALTGNTFQDRVIANYRKQWMGIAPGYETYCISYDHNASKEHSGIGGLIIRDKAGTNGLAFTHAAFSYSFEARLDRKRAIRFGTKLGYTIRDFDRSGYVFADQVIREGAPTSIESSLLDRVSYFDASLGSLYFSEAFWFGVSMNHINKPEGSLVTGGSAPLEVRTSFHTGYRFATDGKKLSRSKTQMTVAAHLKMQGQWDQLDIGAYVDHNDITFGLWYRGLPGLKAYKPGYPNDDAIIAMVGYETQNQFRVVYSYDVTVSWLTQRSGGAHELSLIYEWPKRTKNRKWKAVPCPRF
jgi:type IX secretion system PorP/SprF family membrane protein